MAKPAATESEAKAKTRPTQRAVIAVYALAVFIGAFLLFAIQPLIGKYTLAWFGGGPEVWTACMLFFQVFLLAGYAYAHLLVSRLRPRGQVLLHVLLLAAALAVLPVTPKAAWRPTSPEFPVLKILLLLGGCIGLAYFVLSATGPLMQGWFTRTMPHRTPYRLYAFSNAGSLLALVSYPFIIEPVFTRQAQARLWGVGLGFFALLCAGCAVILLRQKDVSALTEGVKGDVESDCAACETRGVLLWFGLAACASVELLAVTNKICQDIAAAPFLWVLPLTLYLLSFVICFHSERWYVRRLFLGVFCLAIGVAMLEMVYEADISVMLQILGYLVLLFTCCMVCHGELFRLRPHPRHLTRYYLMIAAGGAAGGVFVAVIAPLIFDTYRELYVGIGACCLLLLIADKSSRLSYKRRLAWVAALLVVGATVVVAAKPLGRGGKSAVASCRNFFGVLTVWQQHADDPLQHRYIMQHGTTFHGLQFVRPDKRGEPTAYYGRSSGAGLLLEHFPLQENRRIGVVGLGVGTLAAYASEGDYIRFYEINPAVRRLAEQWFTYLGDCRGEVEIVMGDARLSMEAERGQGFDVLVLDAFASDVVPVHLLTKEAFEIYLRHLEADGVIAVHVSSRHLDLKPVVLKVADYFGLKNMWIEDEEDDMKGVLASDWLLLTKNEQILNIKELQRASTRGIIEREGIRLWTDDYANLLQVLD